MPFGNSQCFFRPLETRNANFDTTAQGANLASDSRMFGIPIRSEIVCLASKPTACIGEPCGLLGPRGEAKPVCVLPRPATGGGVRGEIVSCCRVAAASLLAVGVPMLLAGRFLKTAVLSALPSLMTAAILARRGAQR